MNVVVVIEGREAIPVRAIPLLTDWEVLSPDELAGALTGDYPHNPSFEKLTAHRSENGHLKDVKPRWWSNFPVRQLEALSHRIKHKEISHDDGHEQWQCKSLPVLPPGVFVWKDEFEACFWSAYGPDGEIEWVAVEGGFKKRKRKEFIELDFAPFALPEYLALVMEGFEPQATLPSLAPEPSAAPVLAVGASHGVEPDAGQLAASQARATTPSHAPAATASADTASAQNPRTTATGPKFSTRRDVMINRHVHEWPTIDRDMKDASQNGLAAAKAGLRDWDESAAIEWAGAKGKLKNAEKPTDALTKAMHSMGNLPGRKHTLEG